MKLLKTRKVAAQSFRKGAEAQGGGEALEEADGVADEGRAQVGRVAAGTRERRRGARIVALAQEDRREDADADRHDADRDGEAGGALHHVVEQRLVLHDEQEPGGDDVGELADEVLHAHDARPLVVVGRELIAQCDPGRREHGVAHVEHEGADEEEPEVEALALPARELPEQHEDHARADRSAEDVGPPSPPARACVVGHVAHDRIGQRVDETWQGAQQPDEGGIHAQAQIQDDGHAPDRRREEVVHEGTEPVDELVREGDPVLGRRLVVLGFRHRRSLPGPALRRSG